MIKQKFYTKHRTHNHQYEYREATDSVLAEAGYVKREKKFPCLYEDILFCSCDTFLCGEDEDEEERPTFCPGCGSELDFGLIEKKWGPNNGRA